MEQTCAKKYSDMNGLGISDINLLLLHNIAVSLAFSLNLSVLVWLPLEK